MAVFKIPEHGEFTFDRRRLLNTEAILLERVTGAKTKDLIADFNDNFGPLGVTAFVWLAMRRAGHHVKYAELEFDLASVVYDRSDENVDARPQEEAADPTPAVVPSAPPSTAPKTTAGSKTKSSGTRAGSGSS